MHMQDRCAYSSPIVCRPAGHQILKSATATPGQAPIVGRCATSAAAYVMQTKVLGCTNRPQYLSTLNLAVSCELSLSRLVSIQTLLQLFFLLEVGCFRWMVRVQLASDPMSIQLQRAKGM